MRNFILGLVVGAMLISSAVVASDKIEAVRATFDILVNSEKFEPDNPALVVGGRTYLAVRDTANALGVKIDWDGRVLIGEMKPVKSEQDGVIEIDGLRIEAVLVVEPAIRGHHAIDVTVTNITDKQIDFNVYELYYTIRHKEPVFPEGYLDVNYLKSITLKPSESITGIACYKSTATDGRAWLEYKEVQTRLKYRNI